MKEIDGNAEARARGNVNVDLDPSPESKYEFEAKGNLTCRMPGDASVQVEIERASNIIVKLPDFEVPAQISSPYQLVLGDGDERLTIGASGNISLVGRPAEWDM